ncbi:hypothetical protein [Thermocrinis sp.]
MPLLFSCGIKTNTKPLEEPVLEIKRIGNKVFLRSLEGEVLPEGFVKVGNYWVREEVGQFCFFVKRVEGKKKRECVGDLTSEKVSINLEYEGDRAIINFKGFGMHEVYALEEGRANPWTGKKVKDKIELERGYLPTCYLVVGKEGNTYSEPTQFCVEPMPHPPIREVDKLEYRVWEDKLYLVWSYEPDELFKEFVVLENEKEIGTTKAYVFELKRKDEKTTYQVRVRSIYGKESEGVKLSYNP